MKFIPHRYQEYCLNRILDTPALGLFLDMGLGKTAITLHAINELKYGRFAVGKVLVIAPKKVAEATWQREIAKWDGISHLRVSSVLGGLQKRIKALCTPADIYIINRENVSWLVEYYKNAWPFDMVVIDELSSFKSHSAKRFKSLKAIRPHIKRMIGLTGTPSPNGLGDLWAQVYLLDQGMRLGRSYYAFRDRYFNPGKTDGHVIYSYDLKKGASQAISNAISDICISMKSEDYLELPDVVIDEIPIVLECKAEKAYRELERTMVLEVEDSEYIDAAGAAALSNKLQQLANGAVYDEDRNVHEIHNCKIEAFMELVEQLNGKHALVFYNFQHDLWRLEKALAKTKLRVAKLTGAKEEVAWNNGTIDILLAHPASAAYGLNLQDGGNHVIWFGLNWSLELYQQANKRLHRQGQKEKVIIHHLICEGTRDEDLLKAIGLKEEAQSYLLSSLKARIDKYKEK